MAFNLVGVHGFPEANISQTVLVAYYFDALGFSQIGEKVNSKREQGLGGPQVGDLGYALVSPYMLGDTQLVSCLRGNVSGFSAKSKDCFLVVAKRSQWARRRHGQAKAKKLGHVLVKLHASFEGEDDVVELGMDDHPLFHLLLEIGQDGAKVPPKGNVNLAMVVHKDAAQHREAQKGQGLDVEATTLPLVDKCKGFIHVVGVPTLGGGTWRPTTKKHSLKLNF
jgi:hypothetical protein